MMASLHLLLRMRASFVAALLKGNLIESIDICPDGCSADICRKTVSTVEAALGSKAYKSGTQSFLSFCYSLDLEVIQLIVVADAGLNGLEGAVDGTVTCGNAAESAVFILKNYIGNSVDHIGYG